MAIRNASVAVVLAAALAPGALAETVGSVTRVTGPMGAVIGMRANATFPITQGVKLQVGDLVLVGADASVSLVGPGGCQRTLANLQSLTVAASLCSGQLTGLTASSSTQNGGPERPPDVASDIGPILKPSGQSPPPLRSNPQTNNAPPTNPYDSGEEMEPPKLPEGDGPRSEVPPDIIKRGPIEANTAYTYNPYVLLFFAAGVAAVIDSGTGNSKPASP